MNGTIKLDAKQDITKEIDHQLDMGLCNLPTESKCLLEIDTTELLGSTTESQEYWLYAIDTTRTAGERAMKVSGEKTTSWNKIMLSEKFNHLSTQYPLDKTGITTPPPKKQPRNRLNPYTKSC